MSHSKLPGIMDGDQTKLLKGISNTEYSDVTIYIGKIELPAHASVLAVQSRYFEKALKSRFQEGETKVFRFESGSGHAYWRVFDYLYTGTYSDEAYQNLEIDDDIELLKHIRVYALADFFFIDELKEIACKMFKSKLQNLWVSETLVDCISEVYTTTHEEDKAMRRVVLDVVSNHLKDLWNGKVFQNLVRDNGNFAVDLVEKLNEIVRAAPNKLGW
ncbi:MAG: hypothetical protein M1834_009753 [Cirrosporium novae-zelandiae]|nr:MAG: hypothetical protein M1834_009753 [Cirrosporium novae-zelandiae]